VKRSRRNDNRGLHNKLYTWTIPQAKKCKWHDHRVRKKQHSPAASTPIYFDPAENFVTDLVPSEMACLESSPGRISLTLVWISREEMVDFLEYDASLEASLAIRSKMSLTKELRMAIALLEIPVSGWTCLSTL